MHDLVIGLGFGDEGKGAWVDRLTAAQHYDAVVRYCGGAQAGHNVIVDGVHHEFKSFGAGTLNEVRTHLTHEMILDPLWVRFEAEKLKSIGIESPLDMLTVWEDCLVATPIHVIAGLVREQRRSERHGTVGFGIGEARAQNLAWIHGVDETGKIGNFDVHGEVTQPLKAKDLKDFFVLKKRLEGIVRYYGDMVDEGIFGDIHQHALEMYDIGQQINIVRNEFPEGRLLFESSQGLLLDQYYGFHPHTTWSDVTPEYPRTRFPSLRVLGVTRTYHTRHGNGPLAGETDSGRFPEELHNRDDGIQGKFRRAPLNKTLLDYAINTVKPDGMLISHCDFDDSLTTGFPTAGRSWGADRDCSTLYGGV